MDFAGKSVIVRLVAQAHHHVTLKLPHIVSIQACDVGDADSASVSGALPDLGKAE